MPWMRAICASVALALKATTVLVPSANRVASEELSGWMSFVSLTRAGFSAAVGLEPPTVAATRATGAAMAERAATLIIRARRAARGGLVVLGGMLTPDFLLGAGARAKLRNAGRRVSAPPVGVGGAALNGRLVSYERVSRPDTEPQHSPV
jgi:hypothetical protein